MVGLEPEREAVAAFEVNSPQLHKDEYLIKNNEICGSEISFFYKLCWIFQPLFPFFEGLKSANPKSTFVLKIIENTIIRMKVFLVLDEIRKNDQSNNVVVEDDLITLASAILECLCRAWLLIYLSFRHIAEYIEHLYEEIVPLIPGENPSFVALNKETLSIREICFYSTLHMFIRLTYHIRIYIQNLLDWYKSSQ